ncbi:MAG: response regulator transcription factor [Oxalobacteraceae bacterium]|nr:MAG: response regulator transcription factor [Oxalobacteraceae bacterium]
MTVATSADAHALLDESRPDIVIVDILLRDGPSDSVAARLVEQDIPFVVHSGDMASQFDGTPFAHGTWLPKPSGAQELNLAITAAMTRLSTQPQP